MSYNRVMHLRVYPNQQLIQQKLNHLKITTNYTTIQCKLFCKLFFN